MAPSIAQLTSDDMSHTLAKTTSKTPNGTHTPKLAELDASKLITTKTSTPQTVPAWNGPEFRAQTHCTDHMLKCSWNVETGWDAPTIVPYGPISLMPTASVLHYATECFEGLKVYRGFDGKLRLFRPALNCARMLKSATRIALPGFEPDQLLALIIELCAIDGPKWLPRDQPGRFLYLRPTMIANDPALGVQRPKQALLYCILSLMPILDENPTGLRLLASESDSVRAWPGGFGYAKVGANYGPTLAAQGEARRRGYQQVLWLLPGESNKLAVTEAGGSNFFVVWRTRAGQLQVVTAPLDGKIILDGITRRSLLQLIRERSPELEVVEREYDIAEIVEAVNEGRMVEAFGCGTAFFIAPVSQIGYGGADLDIPMAEGDSGKYAKVFKQWLKDIMYGNVQNEWAQVVEEKN